MIIALIGMSGIRKTHWADLLASGAGFRHICCDALIEQRLKAELSGPGGISQVAGWMGQPWEEDYPARSAKYLAAEESSLEEALSSCTSDSTSRDTVLDTTGSVIYLSSSLKKKLRQLAFVVHLEATPELQHEMFQKYLSDPKPVIWGDIFKELPGESHQAALKRLYPGLLCWRLKRYKELAHTGISHAIHSDSSPGADRFLEIIRTRAAL